MGDVATVRCRSYSAQEFDGCPSCVDAALDAVTQAGLYVVGQSAPALAPLDRDDGPIDLTYSLKMRLIDDSNRQFADDEVRAQQTISAVAAEDDPDGEDVEADPPDAEPDDSPAWAQTDGAEPRDPAAGSMRLDDFQTVLDLLRLAPDPSGGVSGAINGRLFGFDRSICRFEMEVCLAR